MKKRAFRRGLVTVGFAIGGLFAQGSDTGFIADSSSSPIASDSIDSSGVPDNAADTVDVMPRLKEFVKAAYPELCIDRGIEGVVVMDLLVDTAGRVDSIALVKGLHPLLDSSALRAARVFRFSPALKAGQPVPVILRYAYRFTLSEQVIGVSEQVNLSGIIYEKGTRTPVNGAVLALNFADSVCTLKPAKKEPALNRRPCGIPLRQYLEKIGGLAGQKMEQDQLVTQTDSLGRFSFKAIPDGTVRLRLIAPGYKPWNQAVVVKPHQETRMKIFALKQSYNEYEVVVYGKSESSQIEHREISGEEIRRVAGFNGEAVKVVQALPGVARPFLGQSEIIIRGSDNDQSKVLFDGIEIPYLYHSQKSEGIRMLMCRSIFNSDALSAVTLYPGGVGVEHGNFLGGIVDCSSRPGRTDRFHTTLDINLMGYSLLLESPLAKKLSAIGSLRGSFFSYFNDFVMTTFFHEKPNFIDDNLDFSLRLDYTPAANHRFFVEAFGAKDTMANMDTSWVTGRTLEENEVLSSYGRKFVQGIGGWDWTIGPSLKNTLRLGMRKQYFRSYDNMNEGWMPAMHGSEITYDVRDALTKEFTPAFSLTAGVDIHATPGGLYNSVTINDTTYFDTLKGTLGHYSAYLLSKWKPLEKLILTSGLRFDRYPQLDYHGAMVPELWNYGFFENTTRFSGDPSARLSTQYTLFPKHTLSASVGTYSQSPDSALFQTFSRKNITSEKGSQYTLGDRWQCSDLLSLEVNGYFNQQWDRFRYTTSEERSTQFETVDSIDWWKSSGRAHMEGLEFLLRRNHGKRFFGWLGYSLGYSERFDVHSNKWVLYDYNVLNNVQAVGEWALPRENSVGFRLQYTEGYPYTPYTAEYYNATSFWYWAKAGKKNSKRYPPYVGLDLNYSKKWVLKKSIMTSYVELLNIAHWLQFIKDKNGEPLYTPSEFYFYNYDYTALQGFAMIPLATFGLRWEF